MDLRVSKQCPRSRSLNILQLEGSVKIRYLGLHRILNPAYMPTYLATVVGISNVLHTPAFIQVLRTKQPGRQTGVRAGKIQTLYVRYILFIYSTVTAHLGDLPWDTILYTVYAPYLVHIPTNLLYLSLSQSSF